MTFDSSYRRQALEVIKASDKDKKENFKKLVKHFLESKLNYGLNKIVEIFSV